MCLESWSRRATGWKIMSSIRSTTLVLTIFKMIFDFYMCYRVISTFLFKRDVGDFKLASISGITGSQIHCISPGRLLADRSRWELSGKKYSSTRLIYDRFMTSTSANFENPYRMSLSYFNELILKVWLTLIVNLMLFLIIL